MNEELEEGKDTEKTQGFIKNMINSKSVQAILWLFLAPIYVITVFFRDLTILQKILRIASTVFSPSMWPFIFVGVLSFFSYLSDREEEEREKASANCTNEQLVPRFGEIKCLPYEDVTKWSDKIGQADIETLNTVLEQQNILKEQITHKQVSFSQSKKEKGEQVQTVAYLLKGSFQFKEKSSTLVKTEAHEWSQQEEYSWNVGEIHQSFPLSADTWSTVLKDFKVRWTEVPLLFDLKGTDVSLKTLDNAQTFQKSKWSESYDSWFGLHITKYVMDKEATVQFNVLEDSTNTLQVKNGWVEIVHEGLGLQDDNLIVSSTLVIYDSDNELTFVQWTGQH